mgnify:CR=1 FL=1
MTLEEKQELIKSAKTEEELEARMAEIKADEEVPVEETTEKPAEEVEETTEEVKEDGAITPEEERSLLKDTQNLEKRSVTNLTPIERKEEVKMEEKRNSKEYINAYAEYLKSNRVEGYQIKPEERALLTTNTNNSGNYVEVPDIVDEFVRTAWGREELMAKVRKISVAGNFKVQFEVSGTPAVEHTEGGQAVTEEELVLGVVTLIPTSIKKWISVSDEVVDMKGETFLRYIYDELTYRIAKKTADILVSKITSLPQSLTPNQAGDYDSVSADKISESVNVATIDLAAAHLNEQASDITVVMNRLTRAEFVKAAKEANYPMDLFAGVRVVYNNTLPAYSTATAGQTYLIVGDFNIGAMANYPSGQDIELKFDDKTLMTKDLVKILGRRYVGVEAVADKAFTLVAKPGASV